MKLSTDETASRLTGLEPPSPAENPAYLSQQLITYLGSKRSLLPPIDQAVQIVKNRLGKQKLAVFDAFSGSGVVSRFFKAHASLLISNDIEDYATAAARCYLCNRSDHDVAVLQRAVDDLNDQVDGADLPTGFIEELYAPKDEARITSTDRVFYTRANARRLDNYRRLLADEPQHIQQCLLGPLLSKASVHANTAGVFKGFYKNRHTKIGQFGGSGSDALSRIMGEIRLEVPVLSDHEADYLVTQQDAADAARALNGLDLAYLDPPYNQHPYGSNYFMLNLLVNYQRPRQISKVSGIPKDWKRSGYNVKARSLELFTDLMDSLDARYVLVSFNDEGFISPETMHATLRDYGRVQLFKMNYNAFRGSRNLRNRSLHVTEQLFLVERS